MDHLQTEARNPASTNLDELTPLQFVHLMNAEDAAVIPAVASQAESIARAIEVIAERLRAGGRLIYAGAGTSGRLGVLDATECPPTFNAPPGQVIGVIAGGPPALTQAVEGAEDHPEFAERDLQYLELSPKDVLVGIATSGRTPYVLGAVAYARRLGTLTIGLSCNADAELIPHVDLAITPVVGAEILSGSTRLKAGTATKLVLNMLSTGAMVRLGKTFGNLMVDLRATNEKLRVRTNRIVRQLTGLTREQADALLERSGRELKTALVAHLAAASPEEAQGACKRLGVGCAMRWLALPSRRSQRRTWFWESTAAARIQSRSWHARSLARVSAGLCSVAARRGRRTFRRWVSPGAGGVGRCGCRSVCGRETWPRAGGCRVSRTGRRRKAGRPGDCQRVGCASTWARRWT